METFDFGNAINLLKKGEKVARIGWNGKGMYILYVCASVAQDDIQRMCPEAGQILPWIGMKTAQGVFVPWVASQTDLLADDWVVEK